MDEEKLRNAGKIIKIISALTCALFSAFFTLVGSGASELGMYPLVTLSMPVWIAWGIIWGAVCGVSGANFLIKILTKKRNILYGLLLGPMTGFAIGIVNGVLTGTAFFGIFFGIILGSIPGLILAAIFLKLTGTAKVK